MKQRSKKIILFAIIISIGLVIYQYDIKRNDKQEAINPVEIFGGYGLTLLNPYNDVHQDFILTPTDNENFEYKVKFTNKSGRDSTFTLLTYINYEQIDIVVEPSLTQNNNEFFLQDNQSIAIPLQIPTKIIEPGSHILTLTVIAGSNKHAKDINVAVDSYGISGRYNLRLKKEEINPHVSILPEDELLYLNSNDFTGILINQDFETINRFKIPPTGIKAKPGEAFDLAIRAGGYNAEYYIAWITIGWKEVNLFNGNKPWYFYTPKNQIAFKKVTLFAPEEKGDYEITAFLAPNPWKQMDDGFPQDISVNSSYRFTLHVE